MSLSSQSFGYALRLVYGADLTSIIQQKTPDNRNAYLDFASKAGTLTRDRRDDSRNDRMCGCMSVRLLQFPTYWVSFS
jgi:hypothetical protein